MSKAVQLLIQISKAAAQEFKRDGALHPDLVMENAEGVRVLMRFVDIMNQPGGKDKMADTMRKALREFDAVRYAWSTEAWAVDGTKLPDKGKSAVAMTEQGISLINHPDRTEEIVICVEDRETKEMLRRSYRILRPEFGPPTLAPPENVDLTGFSVRGRFMRMFEP